MCMACNLESVISDLTRKGQLMSHLLCSEPVQLYIVYLVLEKPGIYLREIVSEVSTLLGVSLTESAIC